MSAKIYNFGAGPAMMPEEVMAQVKNELTDWQGLGMSVIEVSHRSQQFRDLLEQAEQDLRELLAIPDGYSILFLAGPAREQYAMVPMNLLGNNKSADYLDSGIWSHSAIKEAGRYCQVNVVASSREDGYKSILAQANWKTDPNAAYFFYTMNETVNGVELHEVPEVGQVPLVCDMTSTLLSRPLQIDKYGLIFAGAQKNFGPAGLTLVIVRDDLLGQANATTPTVSNYKVMQENKSLYYTPATFSCYFAALTFRWIKQKGGLEKMAELNQRKANKLYQYIDNSEFYYNSIDQNYRSWMNIPFLLRNEDLNASFIQEAERAGLIALKGHRFVGGMRASIYNAMPEEGVDRLIEFMDDFSKKRG